MSDLPFQNALHAHRSGNLAEAARLYSEILRADPRHFPALFSLGYLNFQAGRFAEAERLLSDALRLNPASVEALFTRGLALQQLERAAEALACFDRALAQKPNFPDAQIGRATALMALKRNEQALETLDLVLMLDSTNAAAWDYRGRVLQAMGRHEEARAALAKARPARTGGISETAAAAFGRARALAQANRFEESLAEYDRAIAIAPQFVEALCNRGSILMVLNRHTEALQSFDAALAINPSLFEILNNRGNALSQVGRFEEAVESYDRALRARPNAFEPLLNRGSALLAARRADEALKSYDEALASRPDDVAAGKGRANALFELGRFEEAVAGFETALSREPAFPYALGDFVYSKLQCCDWRNLNEERAHIAAAVRRSEPVIVPFAFLALPGGPEEQRACASIWAREKYPPAAAPLWRGETYHHTKIRVAYLSANFHNHAVGQTIAGVLEHHDRARFEITGVSWGPDDGTELRARLKSACDRFIDVSRQTDQEAARLIRQMEIDIAVDLMGFTADHRTSVLAARPAPIQVNYVGYAGTMSAPYMDYIIADSIVIPDRERRFYSETVIALPNNYLPLDNSRAVHEATPRRAAGLPDDAFVFACFNNSYKFSPEIFGVWMDLLRKTERSVLWLSRVNDAAARNLAREAKDRGIDPSRLIFAPFVANPADHLARLASADLFLDTLPYNAHATAADALLAGLPVLSCQGGTFAGRVGTSLLHAAGLPELAVDSLDAYQTLALELANDRNKIATLKAKLAANRSTQPLFDTARYTRQLEQKFVEMWERSRGSFTS